jgi:hypothetical protein
MLAHECRLSRCSLSVLRVDRVTARQRSRVATVTKCDAPNIAEFVADNSPYIKRLERHQQLLGGSRRGTAEPHLPSADYDHRSLLL